MESVKRETLIMFWQHALRYRTRFSCLLCIVVAVTCVDASTPLVFRKLVDILSLGQNQDSVALAFRTIWVLVGLWILSKVLWRVAGFVNVRFQAYAMRDVLGTCFNYLLGHSRQFFAQSVSGGITSKVRRHPNAFENIADQLTWNFVPTVIRLSIIVAMITIELQVRIGLIVSAWCTVFILFVWKYTVWKLPYDIARSEQDTEIGGNVGDVISNMPTVIQSATQNREMQRFAYLNEELLRRRIKTWRLAEYMQVMQSIAILILNGTVAFLAFHYWKVGVITVGDFAALIVFLGSISDQLWNLGQNVKSVFEALADAEQMTKILSEPHGVQDAPNATPLISGKGDIIFKNVVFQYHDGKKILQGFSLRIPFGQKIGLMGSSGVGKSTLANLLNRVVNVTSGEIYISGQNVLQVTQASLRSRIAVVPQDPSLFNRSIAENIAYGKPFATQEEIEIAARRAYCHDFIVELPNGYETLVGERGIQLSGGQRQRIAIARAILQDAPILILDEATSQLDSESEECIQHAMRELMEGRTCIVIAHRLSTLRFLDRIVVLSNEQGDGTQVVEDGTHEELMYLQGQYRKIWDMQTGGEIALANGA